MKIRGLGGLSRADVIIKGAGSIVDLGGYTWQDKGAMYEKVAYRHRKLAGRRAKGPVLPPSKLFESAVSAAKECNVTVGPGRIMVSRGDAQPLVHIYGPGALHVVGQEQLEFPLPAASQTKSASY